MLTVKRSPEGRRGREFNICVTILEDVFFQMPTVKKRTDFFIIFSLLIISTQRNRFFLVPMIGVEALPVLEPLPVSIPASKDLIESRPARICGRKSLRCWRRRQRRLASQSLTGATLSTTDFRPTTSRALRFQWRFINRVLRMFVSTKSTRFSPHENILYVEPQNTILQGKYHTADLLFD